MSNEELAVSIQNGQKELIPQLWEQVEKFISQQAGKIYSAPWEKTSIDKDTFF